VVCAIDSSIIWRDNSTIFQEPITIQQIPDMHLASPVVNNTAATRSVIYPHNMDDFHQTMKMAGYKV
jgi:hypothetical protein